jgi:EAL domain-containing protein (putative c-di-GMP-specific phosphodiesterase class I)
MIAKELIEKISDKYVLDQKELNITASIGISIYPENGIKPFELLRKADSAMYHSKDKGRNTFSYFSESMNILASRKVQLEEQLFYAIEKRELNLYFQPKFDLKTNRIIGVEALLRWSNPTLGSVSPDEFITIAEQSNLILKIGDFVVEEALRVANKCRKKFDADFQIAINLSPYQFRSAKLLSSIKQKLIKYQMPSELVEFEITEGVLMDGNSTVLMTLTNMRELGVKLSMDDFGTGYSSLSYLKKFPFDIIKIDRSFVMNMENNIADRSLVKAAISMAKSLELKVVAEGIENIRQLEYLKSYDCEYGQGYLLSKPLPEKELYKYLKSTKPAVNKPE